MAKRTASFSDALRVAITMRWACPALFNDCPGLWLWAAAWRWYLCLSLTKWRLWLVNRDGRPPQPPINGPYFNGLPNWSHDGAFIYFTSNCSGTWQFGNNRSRPAG